jgi:hypothetical protein
MREVLALPAALNSVMREDVAAAAIGESADTIGRFPPFSKGFVGDTANDCFSYFVFYAPVAAGRQHGCAPLDLRGSCFGAEAGGTIRTCRGMKRAPLASRDAAGASATASPGASRGAAPGQPCAVGGALP